LSRNSTRQQLEETQNRLKLLENEGKIAETIVQSYGPSVCLLHVVKESASGVLAAAIFFRRSLDFAFSESRVGESDGVGASSDVRI
jgi:hypothetical protein